MAVLWQRMADLFPNRWLNQVGAFVDEDGNESAAVGAWRSALAGLRGQQLAVGLAAVIADGMGYPPSAGQFRKLCFADVPDEWAAYREACRAAGADGMFWDAARWSHPVVYAAAQAFGSWSLSHDDARYAAPRWAACYREALDRFARGEEMTTPVPKRLAKPKHRAAAPEKAAPFIEKLHAFFRLQDEQDAAAERDADHSTDAADPAGSDHGLDVPPGEQQH